MVIEDPDERSKLPDGKSWGAHVRRGSLTLRGFGDGNSLSLTSAEVTWNNSKVELLKSNLAAGGRGMELSELVWFNGAMCTVDDRTGVVYKISEAGAVGCFTKTLFQKKNKRNPPRISLGVSLKGSKRIFDFDQV